MNTHPAIHPPKTHRVSEGGVVAGWASEFESSKTGQMLAHVTNRVFQFDVMESSAATARFSMGLVDLLQSVVYFSCNSTRKGLESGVVLTGLTVNSKPYLNPNTR